jgi:pimeloyl-ACP methyl ester carboxylesterase
MSELRRQRIDFSVDPGGRTDRVLAGYYYPACRPDGGVLQLLVHGNSYDHRYWDTEQINGQDYSYARYMTERGYAILAVDLPGTGASWKPAGDDVGLDEVGSVLATIIEGLRQGGGRLSDTGFSRIVLVGHSLGAVLSIYMQATWHPADVLVSTGVGALPPRGQSPFGGDVIAAALENEYVLLPPEHRARVFYHPPTADPEVIAFDNRCLRTGMPRRVYSDAFAARADPAKSGAARVRGPVYVQLGEHDAIAPASGARLERECWSGSTDVVVEELKAIGHCFNLHLNREEGWQAIDRYLRKYRSAPVRPPAVAQNPRDL